MGKKKSLEETEEFQKILDMLKNLEGHYMSLTISSRKLGDNDWKADGKVKVGSSIDGKHWGELDIAVAGFDVNSDSAIATVMVSINNYINSPEFIIEMGNKIIDSYNEEPKLPDVLAG